MVFGHHHKRFSPQTIDGVTYHSRTLGYAKEWQLTRAFIRQATLLTIKGRWVPSKAYYATKELKVFKDYREQQLAAELRDAMTIFDSNEMKG